MKAISIRQPWASLIAHGIKDIENRTWKCPQKYIGQRVLIHASANDGFGRIVNEEAIFKLYIQKLGIECKKITTWSYYRQRYHSRLRTEPSFSLGGERVLELGFKRCGSF